MLPEDIHSIDHFSFFLLEFVHGFSINIASLYLTSKKARSKLYYMGNLANDSHDALCQLAFIIKLV